AAWAAAWACKRGPTRLKTKAAALQLGAQPLYLSPARAGNARRSVGGHSRAPWPAPLRTSGAGAIIGDVHALNFRRRDSGLKFNPTGFAVAVLTFALSMALVYSIYGVVPSIFDDLFPLEEEYQHCSH
ncbi:MAG TPA: hypothetical protein VFS10_22250, partial [Pyrinomonadaceae bacterium]|nr:hypothetical protein [Pyrinomonadaceae bacterium]